MDDKENLLDQYKTALKSYDFEPTGVTVSSEIGARGADDTIMLWDSNITGTGYLNSTIMFPNQNITSPNVYISNSGTGPLSNTFPWADLTVNNVKPSGTISLKGENADIDINGESLMTMIRGIQDRLNILCPDPEMEQEWSELAEIRQQYEAKLAECREKNKAWRLLKT